MAKEGFPSPREEGEAVESRNDIQNLAAHMVAEVFDDPRIQELLSDKQNEVAASQYVLKMEQLKEDQEAERIIGPADYDDLQRFEDSVRALHQTRESRARSSPKEKEQDTEIRRRIQKLAAHLAAEDRSDLNINKLLDDPQINYEASSYMARMNQLSNDQEAGKLLGPADYEDLWRFERSVEEIKRAMEMRSKKELL